MIVLNCMDLDLALWVEKLIPTLDNLQEVKIEKWEHSNRICLMIMKHFIPEVVKEQGNSLKRLSNSLPKNEKTKVNNLLAKLISIKYIGRGNIREYIMEMSNFAAKLKSLKLELSEDLIMHLVLIFLHTLGNSKTNGPSMNLYLTMCKRKRGCKEIRLKVLILLQPLRIRKGRILRVSQKGLFNERNQYIQIFVLDIKTEGVERIKDVLELIHTDICDPFPTAL
ncbi:hypothetical protein CR513_29593, partial [Mucuna pruriens]